MNNARFEGMVDNNLGPEHLADPKGGPNHYRQQTI